MLGFDVEGSGMTPLPALACASRQLSCPSERGLPKQRSIIQTRLVADRAVSVTLCTVGAGGYVDVSANEKLRVRRLGLAIASEPHTAERLSTRCGDPEAGGWV
jgi:hypothetical protein